MLIATATPIITEISLCVYDHLAPPPEIAQTTLRYLWKTSNDEPPCAQEFFDKLNTAERAAIRPDDLRGPQASLYP